MILCFLFQYDLHIFFWKRCLPHLYVWIFVRWSPNPKRGTKSLLGYFQIFPYDFKRWFQSYKFCFILKKLLKVFLKTSQNHIFFLHTWYIQTGIVLQLCLQKLPYRWLQKQITCSVKFRQGSAAALPYFYFDVDNESRFATKYYYL